MKRILPSISLAHLSSLLTHLRRDAVWHVPCWIIACAFTLVVLGHTPVCRASALQGHFAESKVGTFILQAAGPHAQSAESQSADKLSFADKLSLAALIISILALVAVPLAMRQYLDAKEQTKRLKNATTHLSKQTKGLEEIRNSLSNYYTQLSAQTGELEDIRNSISTHYLGVFPHYLDEIVEMLKEAQESIIIFCDYPAYGCFSSPDKWLDYKHVIERKIQDGIPMRVTFMNSERRGLYHREQFKRKAKDWEAFISTDPNHSNLKHFYQRYKNALDSPHKIVEELSFDDFEKLMAEANRLMLNEVFSSVEEPPKGLSADMPLYFWLVDGVRAVFAIPSLSDEATEHGFITGEAKLITAFQDMRNRYLERENPE